MAITIVRSSSYVVIGDNSALQFGATDFTMAVRIRPTALALTLGGSDVGNIISKASAGYEISLYGGLIASWIGGVSGPFNSLFTLVAGQWYSIVLTRISGSALMYVDGTPHAAVASAGLANNVGVGVNIGNRAGAPTQWFDGDIADLAMWQYGATPEECTALAKGVSPLLIRRRDLRFYMPLIRDFTEVSRNLTVTLTGSPAAAPHPRIILPS